VRLLASRCQRLKNNPQNEQIKEVVKSCEILEQVEEVVGSLG
jgi:hypothetical protein